MVTGHQILETKLSMFVEDDTRMKEVYQRAARWLVIDPMYIELSSRITWEGSKIRNLSPEIIVRNNVNMITYLRLYVPKTQNNNIQGENYVEDDEYMMAIQIDGSIYQANK
jgi:hypothetical protein